MALKILVGTQSNDSCMLLFVQYLCGGGNTGGRPDRGQMHYRSGLNMILLIEWYR